MKLAILSDVHANLQALEAVLADASSQGAEGYLSLGDHIGFNGDPAACLNLLMPLLSGAVQGNHEAALLQRGVFRLALFVRMMNRTAAMLSREQKKWLSDLPLTTVRVCPPHCTVSLSSLSERLTASAAVTLATLSCTLAKSSMPMRPCSASP